MAKASRVGPIIGLTVGTGLVIFPDPATTLLGLAIIAGILGVQFAGGGASTK